MPRHTADAEADRLTWTVPQTKSNQKVQIKPKAQIESKGSNKMRWEGTDEPSAMLSPTADAEGTPSDLDATLV